jgi:sporulation protein YlmC with PRC-barrel domain
MKTKLMAAASVLALGLAVPAFAADIPAAAVSGTESAPPKDGSMMGGLKSGLTKADDSMRDTADDIKAFIVGKGADHKLEPVLIHRSRTAHGLIGQDIVDVSGKKIADVKDIIIDKGGKAVLVVVSDGGVLGIGDKVAAFDYGKVVAQKTDGKVVMTLSQDMVDHARDFSYDPKDWAKAKVIPAGSFSVSRLLKGDVLDPTGKKIAAVENVHFRDGAASQIIVGFDKTLGMGGKLAALDYDDLKVVTKDDRLDVQLTPAQAAQFESFAKSAAN